MMLRISEPQYQLRYGCNNTNSFYVNGQTYAGFSSDDSLCTGVFRICCCNIAVVRYVFVILYNSGSKVLVYWGAQECI